MRRWSLSEPSIERMRGRGARARGKRDPRGGSAGFTLVELLVASMLLTIILAGVYAGFNTVSRSWRIGEASLETYAASRTALAILSRELQAVVPGSERLFEGDSDEVTFFALVQPLNVEDDSFSRLMRVRYRLRDNPRGRGYILLREEAPVEGFFPVVAPDEEPDTSEIEVGIEERFELVSGVRDLELAYYWLPPQERQARVTVPVEALMSEENPLGFGLPQGLSVRLTVEDPNAESGETTFSTFVPIQGPSTPLEKDRATRLGGSL